jgi:ABC-2 type transport system permease protein
MPLVMMALWTAVAREAPVGHYGQADFVAYFLATFIVRQLTGAWLAWQLSFEVRTGTLAMRLLRPLHPMVSYAVENLSAIPLRLLVSLPVAVLALVLTGAQRLPRDPVLWGVFLLSLLGGWLITFLANAGIGTLALWTGSSVKVMDVWLALYMVFSGYLIPVELFPPLIRGTIEVLPFRYQIGFPVELLTRGLHRASALRLLLGQWIWVGLFLLGVRAIWRKGLRRFAAYGG